MHPSWDIRGTKGRELEGRRIVLCITGSVAAVKSPELARELMRHGADVRAVMSDKATELITAQLMHWATGNEVVTRLTGRIEHVELARWCDLVLVAPATANTIGKIAWAIDDTPVTSVVSVAFGLRKPVVLVPAMHGSMYEHALFRENLAKLRSSGVHLVEPVIEEGKAKLAEVDKIVHRVIGILGPKDMTDMKVLVTAGPTIEPIDPIKMITNRSSGKMGIEVARAASFRGAEVTLIYGPGTEAPPSEVKVVRVWTTKEMCDAFERELGSLPDVIVSAAAAQDFMVEHPAKQKLRNTKPPILKLVRAPRILDNARDRVPNAFIVGFKAEYGVTDEELVSIARSKLEGHGLDMVVANDISRPGAGFGTETNEVVMVSSDRVKFVRSTKAEIAKIILDAAVSKLRDRR
ncbi:MAG: bifunctional phosphopantothenoylcysteine decarboxylase/phosphopantothenate--cysteine ligase CoaBC [Hadesarchaea archaeon]|nr:MAG: bifunctional phosphopantothenoylcysteine decarboxylase/phosphopantothenate--cysteine ligase CoaBC [Hadesarchaea archaeon]HDI13144.1 bifunctional phosphopantothenoylcysteine decarboxylase/phosphopantothenate--cysteine ligase CoaBC [Hadesarchaea archaeon]